jgi:putative transposase
MATFSIALSLRDVEELLAQRGIEVSREAIRCWVNKFGPLIAANLRRLLKNKAFTP